MGFLDRFRSAPAPIAPSPAPAAPAAAVRDAYPASPPAPADVSAARRFVADGLQNVVAGLGTSRDKRFSTTYTLDFQAVRGVLDAMYMSSWLAGKIVNVPADDMTREWVDLSWDGHDNDMKDDQAIKDLATLLDLRGKTRSALAWARLYGGAAIIMSIKGEDLSTSLNIETVKKGSLDCLIVKDRWWLSATGQRDTTPGPNFNLPVSYLMSPSAQTVHYSRVVRFDGREIPETLWLANGYWHASELAHIVDNITDYDAGRACAASMLWEASVDILRLALLKDVLSEDGGEAKIAQRMLTALTNKNINKALVLDKEDEYQQKTTSFGGVKDILGQFVLDVSGAADIPITRLFGQSPAGMTATGESDTRNYYDHIAAKQQTQLRAQLDRLYAVLARSAIGRMPENFDVKFRPLWQVSAVEKATIEKTKADRDAVYLVQGVITEGLVARQLKADNVYPTMEQKDVDMAEELALQPDPVPPVVGAVPGAKPPGGALPPVPGAIPKQLAPAAGDAK